MPPRKRGRPRKYANEREKAQMAVVRKRERRRSKAHERRERLHAQFYGEKWSENLPKEVSIIIEHPEKGAERLRESEPSMDLLAEEEWSPYATENDVATPTIADDTVSLVDPNLCAEQLRLIELVSSGVNVFYTGGAGTGKSTVLRALVKELRRQGQRVQVVTPTGISALNVSGSTYFTWAGWNPGVTKKSIKEICDMAMSKERRQRIRDTDVLIIDEISMLESNQFRRLDRACRAARLCDAAFGGIQVVVTGDFYQLPPVKPFQTCFTCGVELTSRVVCIGCEPSVTGDMHQSASPRAHKACLRCGTGPLRWSDCPECGHSYHMDDEWAFRSDTWGGCGFHCVSLTEVHRQNDPAFIDMLNTLRIGERLDQRQLALLEGRERDVGTAVELSAVRKEVDQKNQAGFRAISGAVRAYRCQDHVHIQPHHPHLAPKAELDGDGNRVGCQDHRFPAMLETKCGMPVILLANIDPGAGLVNGSQGRITGYLPHGPAMQARERQLAQSGEFSRFEESEIVCWTEKQPAAFLLPVVLFENGVRRAIYPVCQDTELGDPPPFSVIARTQIPLLPAWAITIHKSQGMTLERVVINLDQIFEPQMVYVALSRARSLHGLRVVSRVGVGGLQERGRLGGGNAVVRKFMELQFGFEQDRAGRGLVSDHNKTPKPSEDSTAKAMRSRRSGE